MFESLFGDGFNFDIQTWIIKQLIKYLSRTLNIASDILINHSKISASVNIVIGQKIKNDILLFQPNYRKINFEKIRYLKIKKSILLTKTYFIETIELKDFLDSYDFVEYDFVELDSYGFIRYEVLSELKLIDEDIIELDLLEKILDYFDERILQTDRIVYKFDDEYIYIFAISNHYETLK